MGLWSTGFLERMEEAGLYKKPEMVEVVKCKDCKYGKEIKNAKGEVMIDCLNGDNWLKYPNWFCADGERKDNDGY